MKNNSLSNILNRIPSSIYLWTAVVIFAASSSVTRKVIEIGENHLINGRNPISLCNVLFVGNICAFALMMLLFYPELRIANLKQFTHKDWISLIIIATLAGAIAPGLIFAALDNTTVTNVVLIGRLESPLTLAFSVWLLRSQVNIWTVLGSIFSFAGVAVTALLTTPEQTITMMGGFQLGKGELQIAIAALFLAISTVISKSRLQNISLGFFSLFRTALGTVIFFFFANYLYGAAHFAEVLSPFLWEWMLIYAAIIVVAGQLSWFAGLRNSTSAEITLANSFNPLVAIGMAYLILGEIPTTAQYLGGSIILIGIILSLIGNLREGKNLPTSTNLNPGKAMEMSTSFKGL
jgi:drug/metabolite transporter (DMT)-like permease